MINIEIKQWTSHHNHFMYSLLLYCESNRMVFKVKINESLSSVGIVIKYNEKIAYLDYSDDFHFSDMPEKYDFYYKRSLKREHMRHNIFPLNFQVNFAYHPYKMALKMPLDFNFIKQSKVEFCRAIDFLKITNMSHFSMLLSKFKNSSTANNGRVIFCTRLWDPKNTNDEEEKIRRERQNFFRINACRIIKANYKNSFVGVFDSELARKLCPELIFNSKVLSKKAYLEELLKADICIADDGLKDSAGWKIGEYLMLGKAVITTPLNVYISDFYEGKNYMVLTNRASFEELPEKIDFLLEDDKYKQMGLNNKNWSEKYLFPNSYIENILKNLK